VIDVGNNQITQLENISHLTLLEELWVSSVLQFHVPGQKRKTLFISVCIQASSNLIPTLRDLESQLGKTKTLETIYLEGNPCERNEGVNYRRKITLALPQVTQIDAT
jgi:protein phosphatase 1 regulatory subunit 7